MMESIFLLVGLCLVSFAFGFMFADARLKNGEVVDKRG